MQVWPVTLQSWGRVESFLHQAQNCQLSLHDSWKPLPELPSWLYATLPESIHKWHELPRALYVAGDDEKTILAAVLLKPDASGLKRLYIERLRWLPNEPGAVAVSSLIAYITDALSEPKRLPLLAWAPEEEEEVFQLLKASGFAQVSRRYCYRLEPALISGLENTLKPNNASWEVAHWRQRSQLDALYWDSLPVELRPWLFPLPEGFLLSPWEQLGLKLSGWFCKRWVLENHAGLEASFELRTKDFLHFFIGVVASPYRTELAELALKSAIEQCLKANNKPVLHLNVLGQHKALLESLAKLEGQITCDKQNLMVYGQRTAATAPIKEEHSLGTMVGGGPTPA